MLVLGVYGTVLGHDNHDYHDSAAVLVEDGRVIAAIEEERLTRRKHTGRFPSEAVRFCLRTRGVTIEEVDRIVFGEVGGPPPHASPDVSPRRVAELVCDAVAADSSQLERILDKVRLTEHHRNHAFSAFAPSGFDEALVISIDGYGDGISGYVIDARGGLFRVLDTFPAEGSLGDFYCLLPEFAGFPEPFSEYKLMGLAPYGDPERFLPFFRRHYGLLPEGRFEIRSRDAYDAMPGIDPSRPPSMWSEQIRADVAAGVQAVFEDIVFHVARHHQKATGARNLCLAGGTAHNCTNNGKLLRSGLFDNVFVQPAAHDGGVPLGAALMVAADEGHVESSRRPLEHVYWGGDIGDEHAIAERLHAWREHVVYERCDDVAGRAAAALAGGAVLGWMQGRSEFGPRALGNRSILADPRPPAHKDIINAMVKKREAFRPFAPAVTVEAASEYFEVPPGADLSFMTFVVHVRADKRALLGAVTHIDGTARIQTVSENNNPRFWRLLRAFGDMTGTPVLLNTSFNNNAEPIVESIDDGVACFLTTGLQHLVVGDFFISKRDISPEKCLELNALTAADIVLGRSYERAGGEIRSASHFLGRDHRAHTNISKALFKALSEDERARGLAAVLRAQGVTDRAQLSALGREVFDLWGERKLVLRPASQR